MIRVGIFFGGQSREREVSFAGGRTVYDNLNKQLFEPVPIFVDSLGNFIKLDWQYIYKGTIRDFYPISKYQPLGDDLKEQFQYYIESVCGDNEAIIEENIAAVGQKLAIEGLAAEMDFAFLCLHGPYGEDGTIQGLLEWVGIPYSGSGILPSSIGIDKLIQKDLLTAFGFQKPKSLVLERTRWMSGTGRPQLLQEVRKTIGLPFVVKAPRQGSSIGITVVNEADIPGFEKAVNRAFFTEEIRKKHWQSLTDAGKHSFLQNLTDIRTGIGMPVVVRPLPSGDISKILIGNQDYLTFNTAGALWSFLDSSNYAEGVVLEAMDGEEYIFFEEFIEGKEFSCIVVRGEDGQPVALPPTQIVKRSNFFDYRSKYLPGMIRKITPIDETEERIELIKKRCQKLFINFAFDVYARIDGFISTRGEIYLNDPNTTSGMLPSSFFFHQAAEIGLNPSQFLSYIIRTSLKERLRTGKRMASVQSLLKRLDASLAVLNEQKAQKVRVAVIMGGYSAERHISVESGRNIYEKLASSAKYEPIPVFLTGASNHHKLYILPINTLLKDNADDIKEKVESTDPENPVLVRIREDAADITEKYAGMALAKPKSTTYAELANITDAAFIALHGRPGEDGEIQGYLQKVNLPFNGSGIESSQITINKYDTNELLARHGVLVARHRLVRRAEFEKDPAQVMASIESEFAYPFITKPCDDGCSAAVKKIKDRQELEAFSQLIFRKSVLLSELEAEVLHLQTNEEFPRKQLFMVEELIERKGAVHFLEITGGMLTTYGSDGKVHYEIFEPSEALASGEVLSLEEKFLAGEGQNITPARFSKEAARQAEISQVVRTELEKVAKLLNVEGYCRTDAFVRLHADGKIETIIVEVNSLPGMTPATCIFHQAAINGYKPVDFIDGILSFGMARKRKILA